MGPANCAVIGCHNSTRTLEKWKKLFCEIHKDVLHSNCPCPPPFRLWMFLSVKRYGHKRKIWVNLLKRENADKSAWEPCSNDRVCSEHFVDFEPTVANPNPSLKLRYITKEVKQRRNLIRDPTPL